MGKKLTKKQLKKSKGGYITKDENGNYHVYDDNTGELIGNESSYNTQKDSKYRKKN